MRPIVSTLIKLLVPALTLGSTASALNLPAHQVTREVRFASVLAHAVINEVRTNDVFFFERCAYNHIEGLNVVAELSAHAFVNCHMVGVPQPITARPKVLEAMDRAFLARRKELADPNVLMWALEGGVEGGVIGGLAYVALHRLIWPRNYTLDRATAEFVRMGGFAALVVGSTRARLAIKRQGLNRDLQELFDPRLPTTTYLLDQRSEDEVTHRRALDAIAVVIDGVMEATPR